MPVQDCLHTEIGTAETLATDYYHLRQLNFVRLRLQPRTLYAELSLSVHCGQTVKFFPSTGLVLLVESKTIIALTTQ